MKARVWIGLAALLALACNEEEPPDQPPSFDRPTRVAFACFDLPHLLRPQPIALACCGPESERPASCKGTTPALHALVLQSSRGEVAAVDLLNRRTLDSREDVPGYTFLGVGELPTAIVVPAAAGHSDFTYVLGSASRDVTVLKTRAFRALAAKEQATVQTVMLPGDGRDAPLDMVLSPNEDALFVSIPSTGRLLRLPIRRCAGQSAEECAEGEIDTAGITEVQLSQSVVLATPPMSIEAPVEPYQKVCGYQGPISNQPLELAALPPDAATTAPRPTGLALDNYCERDQPCSQRLLVADEALPLIHVIDLAAWQGEPTDAAVQAPILTGAPTRAVVVTPRVPVDLSPESGETQYVYAIDARDGSVLVTENGRLLDVGTVGARRDRVALGGGLNLPVAVTLTVLNPAFDVHGPATQYLRSSSDPANSIPAFPVEFCRDEGHPERSNRSLHGVFVGVGVSDGSVRIVDVHDMALPECRKCPDSECDKCPLKCRACVEDCSVCSEPAPGMEPTCEPCSPECLACPTKPATEDPYPYVRHRTRIVETENDDNTVPLGPTASPYYRVGGDETAVRPSGVTSDPTLRGLVCLRCPEGQVPAFPTTAATVATADAGTDARQDGGPPADGGALDAGPLDAGPPDAGLSDAGADAGSQNAPDAPDAPDGGRPRDGCPEGEGHVCALEDPWAELDIWSATYRGVLPGSRAGAGHFTRAGRVGDAVEFRSERAFCALGVLAEDQLTSSSEAADHLVILGELATDTAIRDAAPSGVDRNATVAACKALVRERDRNLDKRPIAFRIREAYDDRLVIEPRLVSRPRELESGFADDVELVNTCFGNMSLIHELRAGHGYVVVGRERAGFLHRVIAEEGTAHCQIDDAQDPKRVGRAYEEVPFDNGRVAFQFAPGSSPELDATLLLALDSRTIKAVMNASSTINEQVIASLPSDLRWSDTDGFLYMVDIASRGLIQIDVDLFPTTAPARSFQ